MDGGLVPSQTYKDLVACADNTSVLTETGSICIFVPVSLVKIVWDKSGGRTCRRPVLPLPLR